MKQSIKFTKDYKKKLSKKIPEITKHLELRTGYSIKMKIQLDKELGYLYALQLFLDNFASYSKYLVKSTTKARIKEEVLEAVSNFDFKHKKRGGTSKQITKQQKSSALEIECCCCGEDKPVCNFHRNIVSPLFKQRAGYCFSCKDCSVSRAAEILKSKDALTSIIYLCAIYDRPYLKWLADEIISLNLSPVNTFGKYMSRVNIVSGIRRKGATFALSDVYCGADCVEDDVILDA